MGSLVNCFLVNKKWYVLRAFKWLKPFIFLIVQSRGLSTTCFRYQVSRSDRVWKSLYEKYCFEDCDKYIAHSNDDKDVSSEQDRPWLEKLKSAVIDLSWKCDVASHFSIKKKEAHRNGHNGQFPKVVSSIPYFLRAAEYVYNWWLCCWNLHTRIHMINVNVYIQSGSSL